MAPSVELAAIGLARWLEDSRAFCGTAPLVPTGGQLLCLVLALRGVLSVCEAAGVTGLFFTAAAAWGAGQELAFASGLLDVLLALVGFAGLGGRNLQLLQGLALWLLVRVGLALVLAVLFFFEEDLGHGAVLVERLLVAAGLLAVDVELLWVGLRLVLAATLRWTLSPELLHFICRAQGVALARRDRHCGKRHLLSVLLRDYEATRMLEVGHADVGLMRAEVPLPCDAQADFQPRGFLDAVPLGADLEAALHAALHLQAQGGEALLRVDHLLAALCSTGEIRLQHSTGPGSGLTVAGVVRYTVDASAMSSQVAAIRGNIRAVQGLRASAAEAEVAPTLLGPLRLPLEETVLAYSGLRFVGALTSLVLLLLARGDVWAALAGRKVVPHEGRLMEWLQCLWCLSFNAVGLRAVLRHRATRAAVQAAAGERTSEPGGLHKAFDLVRGHASANDWLTAFRLSAGGLGLLLAWGPAELLMDIPILGLAVARADVCHIYTAGIARVSSARIVPLAAQVPLHCSSMDLVVLFAVCGYLLFKAYMCWAVLALWHQYAFGWTTTDLRGAAYLALNPFQPAFGFGERQKLLP